MTRRELVRRAKWDPFDPLCVQQAFLESWTDRPRIQITSGREMVESRGCRARIAPALNRRSRLPELGHGVVQFVKWRTGSIRSQHPIVGFHCSRIKPSSRSSSCGVSAVMSRAPSRFSSAGAYRLRALSRPVASCSRSRAAGSRVRALALVAAFLSDGSMA